jgi:ribosomal protein S1
MQDLLANNEASVFAYKIGQKAKGTVIEKNDSRILIDLPGGVTGIITRKEIGGVESDPDSIVVGGQLEATIVDSENELGLVICSLRRASQDMVWAELGGLVDEERSVKVKIEEANKGGLMAKYKGVKAFLPVSQLMPLNYPRVDGANGAAILDKLREHVGKDFVVRVLAVDRVEGKVILSEKAANQDRAQETLKTLQVGDVVEGEVSGIVKFGIFVTFGGIEGLVHLSELDWGLVSNPAQKFSLGDKVEVVVIGIDGEKLSLSIKRLSEDPWLEKSQRYEVGQNIKGKVLRWNVRGIFVEIEKDVQGIFELSEFGIENSSEMMLKVGDEIPGEIIKIDADTHRIELKNKNGEFVINKRTTDNSKDSEK